MGKKEFKKYVKGILKEKGFIPIKTNKFLIEYSECYITLLFNYGNDNVVINYNICFKAIHGLLNIKEDFNNWKNCDFNLWPILNHYCDFNKKFRQNLYELDFIALKEVLLEMLESYIEPFNNSLTIIIDFINKGRIYNRNPYSKETYIDPYRFLDESESYLLDNGMRPIEDFFK